MYKPISDYGMIGNCRSCALVSSDGSIDWACLPNFDSPAQLCAILDDKKGGFLKISPNGSYKSYQQYVGLTNLLETSFFHPKGSANVVDFMPIMKEEDDLDTIPEYGTKFIRLVKATKGAHSFTLSLKVTPHYAQEKGTITHENGMVVVESGEYKYVLYKKNHKTTIIKDTVTVEFDLKEGEQEFFSLAFFPIDQELKKYSNKEINDWLIGQYNKTLDFWNLWVHKCTYKGDFWPEVIRSALVLKMLTFSPTGAIVAAATTSLPEKIGGELNWDYRYTWLRDASFTVYAFLGLGYKKEAERFIQWLLNLAISDENMVKIMYTIDGKDHLTEHKLPHLDGYMGSKPVRIGNGAEGQKQFDIFGEVLTSISLYIDSGGWIDEKTKEFIKRFVNYCCIHWAEPDAGIWEPRNGDKHNTYSKLMCWAGVDRGLKIAKKTGIKGVNTDYWKKTREDIKNDILTNGYNEEIGSFVAYYGSKNLDTSTLNIPIVGMLLVDDYRVLSTLDNVMQRLVIDWFVLRTSDAENKLQEGEGAFFLSTFWLIDCLCLLGRIKEAKIWLDKIIHDASPTGLYAEEFDPHNKKHLGNYPQAFTHLGLINSVLNLKQAQMFGTERKPTSKTQRLRKVIKSILISGTKEKKLRFPFRFLFRK